MIPLLGGIEHIADLVNAMRYPAHLEQSVIDPSEGFSEHCSNVLKFGGRQRVDPTLSFMLNLPHAFPQQGLQQHRMSHCLC